MRLNRDLCLRLSALALGLSPLLFFRSLEDAYYLPQRLGLILAAGLALLCLPRLAPRRGPLFWAASIFLAWRFFTHLAVGTDAQTPQAMTSLALEAGLFLVAASWPGHGRGRLTGSLLLGAGLAAAYASLQALGLDPWSGGAVDLGFSYRAHGTLGNPNFLGGYLALIFPAVLALALAQPSGRFRWASSAALGAIGLALLLSQTRTAWAASAAGGALALTLAWPQVQRRRVLAFAGAAALTVAALLHFQSRQAVPSLASRLTLADQALQGRAFMSRVALDVALEHPWLGVGNGRFLDQYLEAQGRRLNSPQGQAEPYRYTPEAHNDWLQTAAESGAVGLALLMAMVLLGLRAAWRAGGLEGAALAGGLAAFCVEAALHFPLAIPPSSALFWLGLGQAAALEEAPPSVPVAAWLKAALLLALLAAAGLSLRHCYGSALLNSGNSLALAGRDAPAVPLLSQAGRLLDGDARPWNALGASLDKLGDLNGAAQAYQRALEAVPHHAAAWTNLGLALAKQGALDAGLGATQRAITLNPASREAWANLGKILYLRGKDADAVAAYEQGLRRGGPWAQGWFNLGAIHFNAKRAAEARRCFEEVLMLDPGHAEAARLLKELGRGR